MSKPPKPTVAQRIGEADPLISMAQRAWDLLYSQWPAVVAFFATGGGVTVLAILTDWAHSLGPLGIGLIALGAGASIFMAVSVSLLFSSKRRLNDLTTKVTQEWRRQTDQINPLEREFHKQRIKISEIVNPITRDVRAKRFIDCELIGPSNIVFMGSGPNSSVTSGAGFVGCDIVVSRDGAFVQNAYAFIDNHILGGAIYNCTIIIAPDMVSVFKEAGANFITLTADQEIDSRPPLGIAEKRRP